MAPEMDSARWLAIKDLVVPSVRINSFAEAKQYLYISKQKQVQYLFVEKAADNRKWKTPLDVDGDFYFVSISL